jgi:EAL domain-containing protein (putative c-di-GMP-specific phosphodiesterase class I)
VYPSDGEDAETLFRNAEAALKQAKQSRHRFLFYAPHINAGVSERLELEAKLRTAAREHQFVLHYQPKVDLVARRIRAVEALIRWNAPGEGLVAPGRFIRVLEETGLILEVGEWVIREALATYAHWRRKELPAPRVSVNVSAIQLRSERFVRDLARLLEAAAPDDRGLDIEITESLLMENLELAIQKLVEIRRMGVEIALDDFGTGYSSLSYIAKLPIQAIKIDRSFIRGVTENPSDTAVATAVLSLAQSLHLKAIAEGVETEDQARLLRLLRCDEMQGYLYSPPVPAERIEALLRAEGAGAVTP